MVRSALGPLKQRRGIDYDLSFRIDCHLRAIHRSGRGTFEVNPFTVVTTAVTRALELVFTGFPVGRAAEMRAARVNNEETIGSARYPDAVLLLPLGIDADGVITGRPNAKSAGWFENRARQEKPHEHQEEGSECAGDGRPDDAATHLIDGRIVRSAFNHFCFRGHSTRPDFSRHVYGSGWWSG